MFKCLAFSILLIAFRSVSQQALNSTISLNRFDVFWNLGYNYPLKNRLEIGAEVGVGVNSTFFIGQISPKTNLSIGYIFLDKKKLEISAKLVQSYAWLKINPDFINWFKSSIGYTLSYGTKLMFTQSSFVGLGKEFFNTSVANYLGYEFKIGLRYAI